jgi:nucleoside-diphosphate-sugar epimerase
MDKNKKKILILGSNGFFGKNIKYLLECIDYEIICIERKDVDILNNDNLEILFNKIRPYIVINCCGMIGSSESNKCLNQTDIFNTNLRLNTNVFDCCNKFCVEKLIVFSTYRVLMKFILPTNFDEENISDYSYVDLTNNNIGYLLSKSTMDIQIKLLKQSSNIKITCLILPNIFGLFDNFCTNGRIVASLICKIHKAKLENTDLYIDSNMLTMVNLIFINDIIKIIKQCIYNDINCNIIVLNQEGNLTLKELTNKLSEIMEFNNNIFFKHDNSYIKNNNVANITLSNFKKYFNNFIFTPISISLEETVKHFLSLQNDK